MSRTLLQFSAAAALALAAGAPASAQSLYGPGGLFLHPTASLPEAGRFTPSLLVLPQHNPVRDVTRTWISGSVDYGVLPDLEVGATLLKVAGWHESPSYGGYFKYRLRRESLTMPAVAIGYTHLDGGSFNTRIGFLALRKQLGVADRRLVVGHLGVQYADRVDGLSKHELQPYAGLELGLVPRLTLSLEGRPRMNNEFGTVLGVTLAYKVNDDWRLALTWANNGQSDHPLFGFGAGIALGSRR